MATIYVKRRQLCIWTCSTLLVHYSPSLSHNFKQIHQLFCLPRKWLQYHKKTSPTILATARPQSKRNKIIQKHDFWGQNLETSSDNKHRSTRSVQDTCDGFQENQTVCKVRWTMKKAPDQACSKSTELFGFCGTFCQSGTEDSSAHKRNAGHENTYKRVGGVPCQDPLREGLNRM